MFSLLVVSFIFPFLYSFDFLSSLVFLLVELLSSLYLMYVHICRYSRVFISTLFVCLATKTKIHLLEMWKITKIYIHLRPLFGPTSHILYNNFAYKHRGELGKHIHFHSWFFYFTVLVWRVITYIWEKGSRSV